MYLKDFTYSYITFQFSDHNEVLELLLVCYIQTRARNPERRQQVWPS